MGYKREQTTIEVKSIRIPEAQKRYGLGREMVKQLAKDCGAAIKIGKCFLVNVERMDKFIEEHTGGAE